MNGYPVSIVGLTNTVVNVRLSPGTIVGGYAENTGVGDAYIVFFDKPAAQVVLGTTPAYYFLRCFSFSTAFVTRGSEGIIFDNAISIAAVDTVTGTAARTCNLNLIIG